MCKLKLQLVLLLSLLVFALASCGFGPSDGGGRNTPLEQPVVSTSVLPEVHYAENWFTKPFDVTFSFNQKARISYTVNYWDKDGTLKPETHTVEGQSVTIHCDRNCDINVSASTDNYIQGAYYIVRFKDLDRVSVSYDYGEPVTDGKLEVLLSEWCKFSLTCGAERLPEWLGDELPVIRYTTDGTDPHTSCTAKEIPTSRWPSFENGFPYEEGMTLIWAYAELKDWKSAEDTKIELELARTENPVLDPDSEDDIIEYGQSVAFTAGEGSNVWYTINENLTTDDITDDSWDPSTGWVRCYAGYSIPSPDGESSFKLRVVARDEGKLFSDIVEKTFHVQLPAPVKESETVVDGRIKVIFTREGGPTDSIPVCYVDGAKTDVKTETAYRFSVTVDSGSKISVGLGKEGYVDSGRTVVQPMIKLKSPSVTFKDKEGKDYNNRPLKYKMVTVTANDPGVTLYYRVSDGDSAYSGVYETPLEFRQTGSIEVWAMKENYETSDHKTVSVKVTYDIGDLGPSGGIIVSTAGGMFDDWKYIELAPVRADGSQYKYGYYALKDDSEALKVFDIGENEKQEIGNGDYYTRQLVMTMTGHAYGAIDSSWKIRPNVAGERITKTAASVADSFVYELKTKVNGRTLSFADWYLPNRTELVYILQRQLNGTINSSVLVKGNYWSTEESEDSRGAATLVIFDPESKTKKVSEFTSAAKSNMGYVLLLRKFK